jgi:hypothetical protein
MLRARGAARLCTGTFMCTCVLPALCIVAGRWGAAGMETKDVAHPARMQSKRSACCAGARDAAHPAARRCRRWGGPLPRLATGAQPGRSRLDSTLPHILGWPRPAVSSRPGYFSLMLPPRPPGYFSRVRQACVGDGPPDFQGSFLWRGRLPTAQAVALGVREGVEAAHMGGQLLAVTSVMGPTTCWALSSSGEHYGLAPLRSVPQPCSRHFSRWPN